MKSNSLGLAFFLCLFLALTGAFSPSGPNTKSGRSIKDSNEGSVIQYLSDIPSNIPLDRGLDIPSFDQDIVAKKYGSAPPKTSLEIVNQSHTAQPWILNLIECSHWASLFPSFIASYAVFSHSSIWYELFDNDSLRVMLWMIAPLVMFSSALPPIAMHIYEDWQTAPAQDPAEERFRFQDFNNNRLRGVSITMLFYIIAASNFATIFGYIGINSVVPSILFAAATTTMKVPTNAVLPRSFPNRDLISPSQLGSTVLMATSTTVTCGIYFDLAKHIPDGNPLLNAATFLAIPLISIGGLYEGFIGETTFNQWDHEIAALIVFSGCMSWAWAFLEMGHTGLV